MLQFVLMCALVLSTFAGQEAFAPDSEGFIRNWLILAPIGIEENEGTAEIGKNQIKNEGQIQPKEGDEATIENKKFTWKKHQTADYFIDFKTFIGTSGATEQVLAYAVSYVVTEEEMKGLKLKMGSNDQAKVYVNGAQVVVYDDTRTLEKDQSNSNEITLNKGVNTIVFKVINQENSWQGCVRFVDQSGKAVTNLKVKVTP